MSYNERFPGGCQPSDIRVPGLLDLIAYVKPKTVLEIGCYDGVSTEVFAMHCEYVVAMDPWQNLSGDDIWEAFSRRMLKYTNVHVIQMASPEGFKYVVPEDISMVYIDGDHSEAAVECDIETSIAYLGPQAFIAGHDYGGPDTPGVKLAVDRLLGPVKTFQDTSWLCERPIGELR